MTQRMQTVAMRESRLKIPLIFAADVIHGFRTVFPVPLAKAGSFDPGLAESTARAAAVESSAAGIDWTFAPIVDSARYQRWGRNARCLGDFRDVVPRLSVGAFDRRHPVRAGRTVRAPAGQLPVRDRAGTLSLCAQIDRAAEPRRPAARLQGALPRDAQHRAVRARPRPDLRADRLWRPGDLLFIGTALKPTVEPRAFRLWVAPSAEAAGVSGTFELVAA